MTVVLRLSTQIALAAGTGVLIGLSFLTPAASPLVFVALVPLLRAVRAARSWRVGAGLGWIAGIVTHLVALFWLAPASARFTDSSLFIGASTLITLSVFQGAQLAVFAALASKRNFLIASGSWVLLEWAFPKVFPWTLADALVHLGPLAQAADLGGVFLLSFVVVAVNLCITRVNRTFGLSAAGCIAALAVYGLIRVPALAPADDAPTITVAYVQGGSYDDVVAQRVEGDVDLVVWPETILRVDLSTDAQWAARVREYVEERGVPLILGALDGAEDGEHELNTAYLIEPDASTPLEVYHKVDLFPFGEYVPLGLSDRWPTTGKFVPGDHKHVLELGEIALAPSICYEVARPGGLNAQVREASFFLVNITDDLRLGAGPGPRQHLAVARMRAIETRRWMVRASGSGISAFIDPAGRVHNSLGWGETGSAARQIELRFGHTLYVRLGDWILLLCAALLITGLVRPSRTPIHP